MSEAKVSFFFDPVCPWAWMTSRWLDNVARQRELEVEWVPFSLLFLNEAREGAHHDVHDFGTRVGETVLAHAATLPDAERQAFIKGAYDFVGTRLHPEHDRDLEGIFADFAKHFGIDDATVAQESEYEGALRANNDRALKLVGDDVGTPILEVNGVAFFGPVISPAPDGEEAVKLFDGVVAAASYDGFFELKRSRTRGPQFS